MVRKEWIKTKNWENTELMQDSHDNFSVTVASNTWREEVWSFERGWYDLQEGETRQASRCFISV